MKSKCADGLVYNRNMYTLLAFDRFLIETKAPQNCLRQQSVEAFCARSPDESERHLADKVSVVRQFAKHLSAAGYDAYIIPTQAELSDPAKFYRNPSSFGSALKTQLRMFIEQKRALGVKYKFEPYVLSAFDRFLMGCGAPGDCLLKEHVAEFCAKRENEANNTFAHRGSIIRQFGLCMAQMGYDSYVLPEYKRCSFKSSFVPYIYSHDEIVQILNEIDNRDYSNYSPYMSKVCPLLFRVLYGCGLRVSEAAALKTKDVDLKNSLLRLVDTKYNSERLVAMSDSLCEACRRYFNTFHRGRFDYFFPSYASKSLRQGAIIECLRHALRANGIPEKARVHDFRHTFAVHLLNRWAKEGKDIYVCLPLLSKYIGHALVSSTERYLRLTAEVFPDVTHMFQQYYGGVIPEVADYAETD